MNNPDLVKLEIPVDGFDPQAWATLKAKLDRVSTILACLKVRVRQREALRQAEHLFQTLLHKAFQGELSVDEGEEMMVEVEGGQQRTPALGESVEMVGREAYQMALPME